MSAPAGEVYKQLGMFRADEAADADWRGRVDAAIADLAAAGVEFTAEDVRAIAGDPPERERRLRGSEPCFECCGRAWVFHPHPASPEGGYPAECRHCGGTGKEPAA